MSLHIDFEAVKERNPLAAYCERIGVQLRRSGNALVGKCPLHQEHHGMSFVVFDDEHWHCFGKCGKSGDVIDLEQALGGGTLAEAAERLGAERYYQQVTPLPKAPKPEPASIITKENPFGLPYRMSGAEIRLCAETATRLALDADKIEKLAKWRNWKPDTIRGLALERSLGIYLRGELAFLYESGCKIRWQENGERRVKWNFGKSWLWRGGYIAGAKTVYFTEGEIDTITLIDAGIEEQPGNLVIALPCGQFHITPWVSLFAGKKIIIATDADEVGVKAAKHLLGALKPVAQTVERLALERVISNG